MRSDSPTNGQHAAGLGAVPLFHAAWLFAAGVAASQWLWLSPSVVLVALALIAVLCGMAALGALRIAWLPLAVLWGLLGIWCAEMEPRPAPEPTLATLSDGLLRTAEGTVVNTGTVRGEIEQNAVEHDYAPAPAPKAQPSQRIDLRVSNIEQVTDESDEQIPVSGNVRLTVRWPWK
jgi:competence protein ComEC